MYEKYTVDQKFKFNNDNIKCQSSKYSTNNNIIYIYYYLPVNQPNLTTGTDMVYNEKLSDAEKKYPAFNRELLAAYSSLYNFRFML